ncbi:unnamed protein product, partial [Anisakis simplex]|uniref:NUCKS kinase n=1 Tax=Anisakis simplex TaxID=6269 RepID=A0A0M3KFV7_ANISI
EGGSPKKKIKKNKKEWEEDSDESDDDDGEQEYEIDDIDDFDSFIADSGPEVKKTTAEDRRQRKGNEADSLNSSLDELESADQPGPSTKRKPTAFIESDDDEDEGKDSQTGDEDGVKDTKKKMDNTKKKPSAAKPKEKKQPAKKAKPAKRRLPSESDASDFGKDDSPKEKGNESDEGTAQSRRGGVRERKQVKYAFDESDEDSYPEDLA